MTMITILSCLPLLWINNHFLSISIINQQQQQQQQYPNRFLPNQPLILLTIITISIESITSTTTNLIKFKVPFTDQRGYRKPITNQLHHPISLAISLPLILTSTLYIITNNNNNNNNNSNDNHHLMNIWNHSPHLRSQHTLSYSQLDYHQTLSNARLDLLSFTILNLYSLLLDIILANLLDIYLPIINNPIRLIASTIKSLITSIIFSITLSLGYWGKAISQSMSPFECLFSIFTFQSSLYLTTRLTRRAFTLPESSIFSSISVALMIEVIRLTSARLRYSAYLLNQRQQQQQHQSTTTTTTTTTPISDQYRLSFLPNLFRFPTPAIAIQHVLVSGIFLMAFTLAPLLVLSRRLGQRPTKRTRQSTTTRSISRHRHHRSTPIQQQQTVQKPIWTSEPSQPDYYQRFSNPDSQHHSRQHESALKENLRKIIALSIYASITWIALVVMSHWLGWLFEIGRDRRIKPTWWRRILGPGWLGFFCYSFLSYPNNQYPARSIPEEGSVIGIRWARIAMLLYWWICLVIAIGGWTTYLVRKRRSLLRNPNRLEIASRLSSWRTCLKTRITHLARSTSRPRSSSPSSSSLPVIPSSTTKPTSTTLIDHLSGLATKTSTSTTTTPHHSYQHLLQQVSAQCSPSNMIGKLKLIVRQTFCDPQPSSTVPFKSSTPPPPPPPPALDTTTSMASNRSPSSIIPDSPSKGTPPSTPTLPLTQTQPPQPSSIIGSSRSQYLNFKRKFFHLLVCVMFLPTIPIDIEFSSISFSVAFVIFTFCEFARYFAFYPIGAGIHLFFNEFIDEKDSGPVILSHFYLLTACSTGIWLDGLGSTHQPSNDSSTKTGGSAGWVLGSIQALVNPLLGRTTTHLGGVIPNSGSGVGCSIEDLIGVIVLGVGDSCASIVGKRFGKIKWTVGSSKTVEGSLAFVVSVIIVSLFLRLVGLVHPFPFFRYVLGIILVALFEAFTNQNDNLVLPLYSWSILKLLFLPTKS